MEEDRRADMNSPPVNNTAVSYLQLAKKTKKESFRFSSGAIKCSLKFSLKA